MSMSSAIVALNSRKSLQKQDNMSCSSSPQVWIVHILSRIFLSRTLPYQPTDLPISQLSPSLSNVSLMVVGARWSVMQKWERFSLGWYHSDTSHSRIPRGVSATSVLGQDSHRSTVRWQRVSHSRALHRGQHLSSEWGIPEMHSTPMRSWDSGKNSRILSISNTFLVNQIFEQTDYPTIQLSNYSDTSLTGSRQKVYQYTRSTTSVDPLPW